MAESTNKIKYLIADTTAFINSVQLNEFAENVLTVPDVIAEVRNKRQIRRLCVLPYDLQVQEPRTESVKYCVEFAKKTGDYASLSGIDIKVIALTYELESVSVGTKHLRKEPVQSQVIASKEKPEELKDNTKLAGWYNPKSGEDDDYGSWENVSSEEESEEDCDDNVSAGTEKDEHSNNIEKVDAVKEMIERALEQSPGELSSDKQENTINEVDEVTEEELEKLFEKLKCETDENDQFCDILVPQSQKHCDGQEQKNDNSDSAFDLVEPDDSQIHEGPVEVDDENCGWITPANIKKVMKSLEGKVEDDIVPLVACMSTDFALQNVLKQMNLNICALNGRVIKHMRTYILRCYACFKTTSIMTKVFCPNCGNKTLKRVAVSLDDNGKQVIHINTRRPLTTKYKNQSLPRFNGGKHSRNPILFEDQPIPRQMPSRVAKTKTNALDEDYIAGLSPFVLRDVDSKSAMLRSKGHLKEWARNNTFEEDRRRKHYNRLYK